LLSISFDKKEGIELPAEVVDKTLEKYKEAFRILTGSDPKL
jgi:phosphoribosylaminoimidazole-succinocarboxamide synthase